MLQPDVRHVTGREFGGATRLGVGADGGHQRHRGTRDDRGAGEQHAAALGQFGTRCGVDLFFYRQRLTGQRRFVDLEVVFLDQSGVRGDDLVGAYLDHIAGP